MIIVIVIVTIIAGSLRSWSDHWVGWLPLVGMPGSWHAEDQLGEWEVGGEKSCRLMIPLSVR